MNPFSRISIYDRLHRLDRIEMLTECGCHIWMGQSDKDGYGRIQIGGKWHRVHRVSWQLKNGEIPTGRMILHSCDITACVNEDHLFVGTAADNMLDMKKKGRAVSGEKNKKSKLTNDDILAIRKSKRLLREDSKRFGIHLSGISRIRNGKAWNHLQ